MRFEPTTSALLLAFIVGFSTPARSQEPGKALDPTEVIPVEELQGKTISSVINFAARFRFNGYTIAGEMTRKSRIRFGENGAFRPATPEKAYKTDG
jgi:hypothetical protein